MKKWALNMLHIMLKHRLSSIGRQLHSLVLFLWYLPIISSDRASSTSVGISWLEIFVFLSSGSDSAAGVATLGIWNHIWYVNFSFSIRLEVSLVLFSFTWTRDTPMVSMSRASHCTDLICFLSKSTENNAVVKIFNWYVT